MKIFVATLSLLITCNVFGFDHKHTDFDNVLKKITKQQDGQTLVNYQSLKKDSKVLSQYLETLSAVTRKEYDTFNKDQKLTFLINSYNAFTLKLIIDHYPVKSIKDIGTFFTNPWKKKFFRFFGEDTYLDKIEHEMIRKWFQESRIHFAVNCASIGCPSLLMRAFRADKLNYQLEKATIHFLGNRDKNQFDPVNKKLKLSKIFKWYGGDFKKTHGSVEKFVSKYITSDEKTQDEIGSGKYKTEYLEYDWNLNEYKD